MTEADIADCQAGLAFILEDEERLLSALHTRDRFEGSEDRAVLALARVLTPILRVWPSWCPLPPGFQEECTITLIGTGPEGLN
jgi:hypothetical protein